MLEPLSNYVLVQRTDPTTQTPGGLYIPPTGQDKATTGTVVAVGPGHTTDQGATIPMASNLVGGAQVLFGKYAVTEIVLKGRDYIVLNESDILGVLV